MSDIIPYNVSIFDYKSPLYSIYIYIYHGSAGEIAGPALQWSPSWGPSPGESVTGELCPVQYLRDTIKRTGYEIYIYTIYIYIYVYVYVYVCV